MNKQMLIVAVVAVLLFVVAIVGALRFTGGDSGAGNGHTMQNGQTMTGPMDTMTGDMSGMTQTSP